MAGMTANDNIRTSDTDLVTQIRTAVMRAVALPVWGESVGVNVTNGMVELSGYMRTRVLKERVQQAVWTVKGVREVKNNLVVDTELEVAVAHALASDAKTSAGMPGILVGSAFGEIYLKGKVNSLDLKKAAEQVAKQVATVRAVTNELVAPEPPKPAAAAKPAPKPAPKPAEEESE